MPPTPGGATHDPLSSGSPGARRRHTQHEERKAAKKLDRQSAGERKTAKEKQPRQE